MAPTWKQVRKAIWNADLFLQRLYEEITTPAPERKTFGTLKAFPSVPLVVKLHKKLKNQFYPKDEFIKVGDLFLEAFFECYWGGKWHSVMDITEIKDTGEEWREYTRFKFG